MEQEKIGIISKGDLDFWGDSYGEASIWSLDLLHHVKNVKVERFKIFGHEIEDAGKDSNWFIVKKEIK